MKEEVKALLDRIRPTLQADGGDVELIDVVDGEVTVRLVGACKGCPNAQITLKQGIEKFLKKELKGIKSVTGVD